MEGSIGLDSRRIRRSGIMTPAGLHPIFNYGFLTPAVMALWDDLEWVHQAGNRREYFMSDLPFSYTYGSGRGKRTYVPSPWVMPFDGIKRHLEQEFSCKLEACVLNGYGDERDALGWHADDSPEMDDSRPIVVVSFGAERTISTRSNDGKEHQSFRLVDGSVFVMPPGFQDTHQHKIPKHDRPCGKRISATYRGWVNGA